MQNLAPIALFVYNRPDHTRRTLNYLAKNLLAEESRLFIFCDGPKTEADKPKVDQVRQYVKTVTGFKSVKIITRDKNMGLANSIIDGVTELLKEYGKVIVFEDDMLSSPYTLQYFNEGLKRYANADEVMHIGSYMFPVADKSLPQTFFHRIATSWGWATWDRAWQHFNPDIDDLISQFDSEKKHRFTIEGTMNFWKQMMEFKAGKNNSWAIRWYASIFLRNGLTLNPSQSLVQNIGRDGTGVHSNIEDIFTVQLNTQPVTEFPPVIAENRAAHEAIRSFLKHRKGSLLQRGMRLLNQWKSKYLKTV